MASFTLVPTAPFDMAHTLAALSGFAASPVTRRIRPDAFRQAWRPDGTARPRVAEIRSLGSVDHPRLAIDVDGRLDGADRESLARAVTRSLALALDVRPLETVDDPPFHAVLSALRGYHPPRFSSPFEAACWALVRQRTPPSFAVTSMARIASALGERLVSAGETYQLFPEPSALAHGARPALLAATNNTRKVDRLVETARAFLALERDWLPAAGYEEAYRWLLGVPGLGPWSAEFVLQRALGRFERVPWTDTGALLAISRVYAPGLSVARGSARELAERYGWLQGLWLQYLKRYVFTLALA